MPAVPLGLNGEPFAEPELPGVTVNVEHVVFGAPGWPGPFGLGVAKTAVAPATAMTPAAVALIKSCFNTKTSFMNWSSNPVSVAGLSGVSRIPRVTLGATVAT